MGSVPILAAAWSADVTYQSNINGGGMAAATGERKKSTITEIRDSKKSGDRMVYTSVLAYTSAKWAEAAGVDVCVVGDSLAMTCHGHPNTIPSTMDMTVLPSQARQRCAPSTLLL